MFIITMHSFCGPESPGDIKNPKTEKFTVVSIYCNLRKNKI